MEIQVPRTVMQKSLIAFFEWLEKNLMFFAAGIAEWFRVEWGLSCERSEQKFGSRETLGNCLNHAL